MIHGICEYAQRTSSLRMCNTLHENDACILHIQISSFVRDIFQDARAKLYNTELAISKLYGHVWTTWFSRFFSHWNSLPSWTELAQEPSNRLILCWGYFTWKHISGILFLRAYIREKHHFKCMCYLFWSGGSNLKVSFNFECHKGMPKWCETAVFPQVSTQSMNATMKLMASSGLWPCGSRRACLWEIELPNQHC